VVVGGRADGPSAGGNAGERASEEFGWRTHLAKTF
jgi:hypothetical protein